MKFADLLVLGSIISTNGEDIAITPDGAGNIVLDGLSWPSADGSSNQILSTNGSGTLSWVTGSSVSDTIYGAGWDGDTTVAASKNAIYDKIESIIDTVANLSFVDGDLTTGVLTVTGTQAVIAVLDNSGNVIVPDEITYTANTDIDISSFGTITGTWTVVYGAYLANYADKTMMWGSDYSAALATGDGQMLITIPSSLDGKVLKSANAVVYTASSSGLPTIQIHNLTDTADMLSTRITIDATELTSYTAVAPSVVDAANDDVATGDILQVDVDVAGTGTTGLDIHLIFGNE